MSQKWFYVVVLAALCLGLAACFYVTAKGVAGITQGLLLSILLAILSILAAWLTSGYFAEISFRHSLRTFALKAADHVSDLSNELDRLSVFLQQELNANDYRSPDEELLAKELRIESAIHIIQALKSVNNRSLSDWEEIIGEEISAQRVERHEHEEDLRELVERVEALSPEYIEGLVSGGDENTDAFQIQMEAIRAELRLLASQIGVPVRFPETSFRTPGAVAVNTCPVCGSTVKYRQRQKRASVKLVRCAGCKTKLLSTYDGDGFVLEVRRFVDESIRCPTCGEEAAISMENALGSVTTHTCSACQSKTMFSRSKSGVNARPIATPALVDSKFEELLARVRNELPDQPWPKGTSKVVADKIGLSQNQVALAIAELIRRGIFKYQIDGKLFEPLQTPETSSIGDPMPSGR